MDRVPYRCLAVRQPWAWAIVAGVKDIENRTWTTDYRGPVVIQASSSKADVSRWLRLDGGADAANALTCGALIGIAELVDIEPLSEALESNPWAWGPYCWRFTNARAFKTPIAAKGKLNLYALDAALEPRVNAAVAAGVVATADSQFGNWVKAIFADQAKDRDAGLFDSYAELDDGPNLLRLAERFVRDSGDSDAFASRAMAKWSLQDRDGALSDLTRSLELDQNNPRPYVVRAFIREEAGETSLAQSDRRAAEKLLDGRGTS
jgi:tetratricopeptide (TPR) repeat protein